MFHVCYTVLCRHSPGNARAGPRELVDWMLAGARIGKSGARAAKKAHITDYQGSHQSQQVDFRINASMSCQILPVQMAGGLPSDDVQVLRCYGIKMNIVSFDHGALHLALFGFESDGVLDMRCAITSSVLLGQNTDRGHKQSQAGALIMVTRSNMISLAHPGKLPTPRTPQTTR